MSFTLIQLQCKFHAVATLSIVYRAHNFFSRTIKLQLILKSNNCIVLVDACFGFLRASELQEGNRFLPSNLYFGANMDSISLVNVITK